ncbi:hypothetical protein T4B_5732 [Trichinella pseudospiralis]|uniref:Uncharacterized protein n=1 Tax=Trichinella pseudospiralis TaxID=6337 RepID=A0A0V1IW86_TRIPS|nr:hypothetical protein T4B_5732 [Trichinella pseudospiralis]
MFIDILMNTVILTPFLNSQYCQKKYFMKLYMYPVAVYMMWQLTFQSRGLAVENDEIRRI